MKVALVAIGNSRGIRLPKAVLEQCGFGETVEMTVEKGKIILAAPKKPRKSKSHPREGWEEAFAANPAELDDEDREWLNAPLGHDDWK